VRQLLNKQKTIQFKFTTMDKNKLTQAIKDAAISDNLKEELLAMVGTEKKIDKKTAQKISDKISDEIEITLREIGDIMEEDAIEGYEEESGGIDKELNDLEEEVNQKTEEVDLAATRSQITGKEN